MKAVILVGLLFSSPVFATLGSMPAPAVHKHLPLTINVHYTVHECKNATGNMGVVTQLVDEDLTFETKDFSSQYLNNVERLESRIQHDANIVIDNTMTIVSKKQGVTLSLITLLEDSESEKGLRDLTLRLPLEKDSRAEASSGRCKDEKTDIGKLSLHVKVSIKENAQAAAKPKAKEAPTAKIATVDPVASVKPTKNDQPLVIDKKAPEKN